jgi:hypothetical protein
MTTALVFAQETDKLTDEVGHCFPKAVQDFLRTTVAEWEWQQE